jgi:hypothetical protein
LAQTSLPGQWALVVQVHWPASQLCPAAQAAPQPPQLLTSVCSLTHRPLQRLKPALQLTPHAPLTQVGVALAGAVQTVPQAPQLCRSVCSFTHCPLQRL